MNTTSVVNEILLRNPDWTDTQVLDIVNNLTKFFCKRELDSNVYIDPATGNLPYLTTTAGTYTYSISIPGVSLWSVKEIVVDPGSSLPNFYPQYSAYNDRNARVTTIIGKRYQTIPCKKNNDSDPSGLSVTFSDDPGTTTTVFRVAAFESPAEVLSLSVNIPLDDRYRYTVMIPAVQAMIDALDNGRTADAMQYIEDNLVPRLGQDLDVAPCFTQSYSY